MPSSNTNYGIMIKSCHSFHSLSYEMKLSRESILRFPSSYILSHNTEYIKAGIVDWFFSHDVTRDGKVNAAVSAGKD